ncbi:MAG: bifunctional folylpolyglutamate synthase/dihydrofolate synthase [Eggerthellaceae bacterium]|nr:bifunctional folylpolyglutamate synthase/dihydrofolate synthase [Eggerthellaceae bacterium]
MAFDAVKYLNDPSWFSSRYGLDRMRDLMGRLGNPQDGLRYVHVAGTNGKGSTCAFLDAALRAAGYHVGLYTSPYIECFEERIRVDGENIPPEDLLRLTLRVREAAEAMQAEALFAGDEDFTDAHPTAFELMTAVAFLYYAERGCDIVVLEVGLGGLLDATNIIAPPEVAVIVRLGIEHTDILGKTLPEIASQKAGIIKPGSAVVSWPQEPEALDVVQNAALTCGNDCRVADFDALAAGEVAWDGDVPPRPFTYRGVPYRTRLLAAYQPKNAAVALEALDALRLRGWAIPVAAAQAGMAACTWPGRFEVIGTAPLRIVDGGHNPQGADALAETLDDVLPKARPIFVIGILADKDWPGMLRTLAPYGSAFFCVTPPTPRALPAEQLAEALRELVGEDIPVTACGGFAEAAEGAKALAATSPESAGTPVAILATGSLYSVASEKAALR